MLLKNLDELRARDTGQSPLDTGAQVQWALDFLRSSMDESPNFCAVKDDRNNWIWMNKAGLAAGLLTEAELPIASSTVTFSAEEAEVWHQFDLAILEGGVPVETIACSRPFLRGAGVDSWVRSYIVPIVGRHLVYQANDLSANVQFAAMKRLLGSLANGRPIVIRGELLPLDTVKVIVQMLLLDRTNDEIRAATGSGEDALAAAFARLADNDHSTTPGDYVGRNGR